MHALQSFRMWARRAPVGERVAAVTAAALVTAALCWALVPAGSHPQGVATAGGSSSSAGQAGGGETQLALNSTGATSGGPGAISATGQTGTGSATNGLAGAGTASGVTASQPTGAGGQAGTAAGASGPSGGGGSVQGKAGCTSPPGTAPGVTATQIKIAVTITNIFGPAGNETFGGVSPSQAQAYVQYIINGINASGGVACRKLVPQYYDANPVDASNMQSVCLNIVQAGDFADIDQGGESVSPGPQCLAQNHIPYFDSANLLPDAVLRQYYPYLFVPFTTYDTVDHNTVFALRDRGFFQASNGFRKLGFVYLSCYPQVINEFLGWLHQAGLSNSQIVTYDLGCPSTSIASPSDEEQAVLKFQESGVTNVTTAYMAGSFSTFTAIAGQQGFRPKYGLPDEALVAISYGSQHPDYSNIANAIAITDSRYAEEHTPKLTPTAATLECNSFFTSHGQPGLYQMGVITGANMGAMCDELWMFKAALEHAPTLSRAALASGLQAAKTVDFSYPFSPNDFSAAGVTSGGEYWRTIQFLPSCTCWQVVDPTFRPEYP